MTTEKTNDDMLKDLQKEGKLVDQAFFQMELPLHLDRWKEVPQDQTPARRSNVCFVMEK